MDGPRAESPPDADKSDDTTPRTFFGWAPWRATMLAGSVVLLIHAIANAATKSQLPSWVSTAAVMCGYGLLIAGFTLAMRARRK